MLISRRPVRSNLPCEQPPPRILPAPIQDTTEEARRRPHAGCRGLRDVDIREKPGWINKPSSRPLGGGQENPRAKNHNNKNRSRSYPYPRKQPHMHITMQNTNSEYPFLITSLDPLAVQHFSCDIMYMGHASEDSSGITGYDMTQHPALPWVLSILPRVSRTRLAVFASFTVVVTASESS